ncbi:MAG TPA: hypothetical protein VIT89_12690 [Solirubrobacterales bacterium]
MFVNVQLPFADLRPFLGTASGRLALPGWPSPQVDAEFVRAVGAVRQRRAGGLAPWMGEGYFADATRAVRFPPRFARWPYAHGYNGTTMQNVFRRFFSDGRAVARLEIGFAPRNRYSQLMQLDASGLLALITSCISVPVRVPAAEEGTASSELLLAGRVLARHLLRATTKNGSQPQVESWCLRSLRPIVVVIYHPDEISAVPHSKKTPINADGNYIYSLLAGRQGVTAPVWLIPVDQAGDVDHLRRIRLHLSRLHAEREVFKWTLSCAAQGRLAGPEDGDAWDRLQAYLNETDRLLSQGSVYGIDSAELKTTLGLSDLVNPGERQALLVQLRGMRGNVYRKVEEFPAEKVAPQITFVDKQISVNSQIGEMHMEDKRVSIGDVSGGIYGAVGNDINIENSFQRIDGSEAPDDVKTILKELVQAVEGLKPKLEADNQETVVRDLEGLVGEATALKPRRGTLETLGDGLVQAAKTVGEVGLPVVKLVTQLLVLFA